MLADVRRLQGRAAGVRVNFVNPGNSALERIEERRVIASGGGLVQHLGGLPECGRRRSPRR